MCHTGSGERKLPTRLLHVNPSLGQPDDIRLDTVFEAKSQQYAALSYCWGLTPKTKPQYEPEWRTIRSNLEERCRGFNLSDLPKTLKDAVEVTRQLGLQYLWIDSLCIIQEDYADWKNESIRMDAVFSSAYCTIAATAAEHSNSGFLQSLATNTPTNIADFDNDTNKAPLNKRAWVMQERYLSPRTIHFCENRVYGECGGGVYVGGSSVLLKCEDGTEKYFQLDPQFPDRLHNSGLGSTIEFLQSLIEDYSGRDITDDTDRPVAIEGLMKRISKALPSNIFYGIIEWYIHRTLLWRRVDGPRTPKIPYKHFVPSWSWMAYPGHISFVHNECNWGDLDVIKRIHFDEDELKAVVWKFADSDIRIRSSYPDTDTQLLDLNGSTKGWICLDTKVELLNIPDLIVLARLRNSREDGSRYFVMFVEQQQESEKYERCGIGMIHEVCEVASLGEKCIV